MWFSFSSLIFFSQAAGLLCIGSLPRLFYWSPRSGVRKPSVVSVLPYMQRGLYGHEPALADSLSIPCSSAVWSPCTFLHCKPREDWAVALSPISGFPKFSLHSLVSSPQWWLFCCFPVYYLVYWRKCLTHVLCQNPRLHLGSVDQTC